MRITQLDLRDYGHLHSATLALEHPDGSLRIVVGPNEAGKSTLREAIRAVMFGHSALTRGRVGASRIAARITTGDLASPIAVVRRARGPLETDDGRALDDDEVAALLPCGATVFEQLFLLDHDTLRRHAESLLQADGGLGALVFGASLGGGAVEQIGTDLDAELAALVRPRSSSAELNRALDRLGELDTLAAEQILAPRDWAVQRDALVALEGHLRANADRREELVARRGRLERVQATADARVRRTEAAEAIASLRARGVCLDPDDLVRLSEAYDRIAALEEGRERADAELEQARSRRDAVRVDEQLGRHAREIAEIHAQRAHYEGLRAKADAARRALRDDRQLPHAAALEGALADLQPMLELARETERDLARSAEALAGLERRRGELGLDHIPLGELAALAVPTEEEIEAARVRHDDAQRHGQRLASELATRNGELAEHETELQEATQGAEVPTLDELHEARARRDNAWLAVRAWLVDDPPSARPGERERTAAEFDARLADVDRLVDAALLHVDRMATAQRLRTAIDGIRADAVRLREEIDIHAAAAAELDTRWRARWDSVGVRVDRPEAMRAWAQRWSGLVADVAAWRAESERVGLAAARVDAARVRVQGALGLNGVPCYEGEGFAALMGRAGDAVTAHREEEAVRRALDDAQIQIRDLEDRLDPLRELLGASSDLAATEAIGRLHELVLTYEGAINVRRQLDEQIAQRVDVRESLDAELTAARARLELERERHGIEVGAIDEVVRRSQRLAEYEHDLTAAERELSSIAPGIRPEELDEQMATAGAPDVVAARLAGIATELRELEHDRERWLEELGEARAKYGQSRGQDRGASIHDDIEATLAHIARVADDAAVLTLAREMLRTAIGDAGRGGEAELAQRAGEYFKLLTAGEFCGLELETHDAQVYAVALRASGERLYPPSLSDGTLDQLWLAWRLAGIEHHIERVGPVPVVVDDALVHFDDGRAAAAFSALATLASRTQVIVLTHHRHLLDVARRALGPERVLVTELAPRSRGVAPVVQHLSVEQVIVEPLPLALAPKEVAHHDTNSRLAEVLDDEWRAKAELVERSGIAPGAWSAAIKSLVETGVAQQQGAGRGVRYRRAVPTP